MANEKGSASTPRPSEELISKSSSSAEIPGNLLGTFLRSRRRALGKTLAQISSECHYSLSLVSKAELGQLSEGPALKLLERLAKALNVDVTKLVQLKDEDAKAAKPPPAKTLEAGQPTTETEQRLMYNFRALDDRLQRNLLGQAQLIRALQEGRGGAPSISADLLESAVRSAPLSEKLALDLASSHEAIGRKYQSLKQFTEAAANYESAYAVYGQLGRLGSAARVWFHRGCILNHLSRYGEGANAEQQQKPRLDNAEFCFASADELFGKTEENGPGMPLLDNEKEYIPENLRHWAINDMHTARAIVKESDIEPEYHVAVLRHYLGKASRKQERALRLFTDWIQELEDRLGISDESADPQERDRLLEMLAAALHRKGLLHSNIAAEQIRFLDVLRRYEDDAQKFVREEATVTEARTWEAVSQSAFCRIAFTQAIRMRRDMALAATTQESRDHNLSKLANNHQALAYARQNYVLPSEPRVQFEESLFHYLLAEKIDALLQPGYGSDQREAINLLSTTLERDGNLGEDMQVAIRRRVEERINKAELGTRERPVLSYDLEFSVPGTK